MSVTQNIQEDFVYEEVVPKAKALKAKNLKLQQGQRSLLDEYVEDSVVHTDSLATLLFIRNIESKRLLSKETSSTLSRVYEFRQSRLQISTGSSPDIANMFVGVANLSGSLVAMSLLDIEGERMPMYMRSINIDMYVTSEEMMRMVLGSASTCADCGTK
ncbi:hypothetical protein Tco_1386656 [Tanacetum coccineum]